MKITVKEFIDQFDTDIDFDTDLVVDDLLYSASENDILDIDREGNITNLSRNWTAGRVINWGQMKHED